MNKNDKRCFMLTFKKIELEDIQTLKAYFSAYPARQCDRSCGATVMWRNYFENKYAIIDGTIILSSNFKNGLCFTFPIGRNIEAGLDAIEEYCNTHNIPMVLCSVNKKELPVLLKRYSYCVVDADRDWFDYLYEKDALLNLVGRKYGTPRNHINKFKKLYPDWTFEKIDSSNIPQLIDFTHGFTFNSDEKDEGAFDELKMCIEVLENYDAYGMLGGVLKVNGKIVGYSMGEIIGDTLFCHVEKADIFYGGAYQMLTNQYLRMYAAGDEIKFVNREEDCGDPGLRKSKLSYNPIELLEKSTVTVKKG